MNRIDISKRRIGVSFDDKGLATVLVWAPLAQRVAVLLPETNSRLALDTGEYGYWHTTTDQIKDGTLYKYILDDDKELPDPAPLSQPQSVHGPSQAIDVAGFGWTDKGWKNVPLGEYIIYELHTGTFTGDGTFAAIEAQLDHLKELGITAIEIMPVAQFPGNRNWGYDGVYPFAVQDTYGGAAGLQHLVNACHEKGLAVVLDVVYNHLGPEGNYLGSFASYFTDKYHTPWGSAVNFDDAWCDSVRRYFIENMLMWFRDFHIDALRMDAVHAIKDFSPVHILAEMKMYVDQLMEKNGRKHYLIVECDLNDTRFINRQDKGGYAMDAQWTDEFHHSLRVASGNERNGYYSDFNGIADLAKAYKDAYVYDGIYSAHRLKTFGSKADKNTGQQFVVFSQNHDQVGNRMLGERTSELVSFEMRKLMAGAVMVSPYIPLLFMGEEWSETNPFLYFISHTDPELVAAVRKGRKAEFAAFNMAGEAPDPQSVDTFLQSKPQWHLLQEEPHKTMFQYYQALIALRKQEPVLQQPDRKTLDVQCSVMQQTLLLHRWQANNHLVCMMNFSKEKQTIPFLYDGNWNKAFDSADPKWKGPAAAAETISSMSDITLQAESILIYTHIYV